MPENAPELVERTLPALHARGGERVPVTRAWRELLRFHPEYEAQNPAELALEDFLRFAKLRPLLRPVGKALLAVTASEALDEILEARQEDQWELWASSSSAQPRAMTRGGFGARGWPARIEIAHAV